MHNYFVFYFWHNALSKDIAKNPDPITPFYVIIILTNISLYIIWQQRL